jgi:hypothetical protein
MRLAALQFRVRDPAALATTLSAGGIAHRSQMGAVVVSAPTMGATLAFDEAR